jgi:hypothetical protein
MKEIKTSEDVKKVLNLRKVILLFGADWSEYAVISKTMMAHVERYTKMENSDIEFYIGYFENDKVQLARAFYDIGIPTQIMGVGSGSIVFLKSGKYLGHIRSVIGEGTFTVFREINKYFGQ